VIVADQRWLAATSLDERRRWIVCLRIATFSLESGLNNLA